MSTLQIILMSVQLLVAVFTLCGMLYAFKTFLSKPKDSMIKRIIELEVEVKELKNSLHQGNDKFRKQDDRFRKQDDTNEVLLYSILALIDFEMQYCLTEKVAMSDDLKNAKEDIQKFLSKRGEKI